MKAFREGINIGLFLAVMAFITDRPRMFNMEVLDDPSVDRGTICCFAGATNMLKGMDGDVTTASTLLNITMAEANSLFFTCFWPWRYRHQLSDLTPGTRAYLAVALKRFRHFLKTGE